MKMYLALLALVALVCADPLPKKEEKAELPAKIEDPAAALPEKKEEKAALPAKTEEKLEEKAALPVEKKEEKAAAPMIEKKEEKAALPAEKKMDKVVATLDGKKLDEETNEIMGKDELLMALKKKHLHMMGLFMQEKYEEVVDTYYAPDAKFLKPDGSEVTGKMDLIAYFELCNNETKAMLVDMSNEELMKAMSLEWTSKDLLLSEEFLVDHSEMGVKLPAAMLEHKMRMLTVWKMVDGEWKIFMDSIFSKWQF